MKVLFNLFVMLIIFPFFEQTSQLDAFTNADQLSQIGIPYGVTSKKAQIQDAEANVRLFPKTLKTKRNV